MIKKYIGLLSLSLVLLTPMFIDASQFLTDQDLEVFPSNERLEFNTKVNTTDSQSFSIKNSSDEDKTLIISQKPDNYFEYNGSTRVNVGANSTSFITIQFKPTKTGNFDSRLRIKTEESGETKTINLQGNSFSSTNSNGLQISNNSINFGTKPVDSFSDFTLRITNNNDRSVNINTNRLDSPFNIKSFPSNIPANSSVEIIIEFEPTREGEYKDNLTINTNDQFQQTFNLSIKGKTDDYQEGEETKDGRALQLDRTTVNFGQKRTGTSTSQSINLYNPNSFSVEVKLDRDIDNPFEASFGTRNSLIIPARKESTIKILFEPTNNGSYNESLRLRTNLDDYRFINIQATGSASGKTTTDNPFNYNNNNTTPQTLQNQSTTTKLNLSKTKINPDLNETVYFNLYLGSEFDNYNNKATVKITDLKNNNTIYSQTSSNLKKEGNNWKLKWNGRNFNNNTVIEGSYRYELVTTSPSGRSRTFTGFIQVSRQKDYKPQPITTTPPKSNTATTPTNRPSSTTYFKKCMNFEDVNYDSNLCSSVEFLTSQKVIRKDTKFNKNNKVTRAQALSAIIQLLDIKLEKYSKQSDGNLGYNDLNTSEWYMPFIKTAQNLNTQTPVLDKKSNFRPNEAVTRAELYKLFIELANNNKKNTLQFETDYFLTIKPFKDTNIEANTDWFTPYAGIAQKEFHGTNFARKYFGSFQLNDRNSKFSPHIKITKEEFAEFLYETKKLRLVKYK